MKDETILALGAFVFAVVSGILTYVYTRRQFQAATLPSLYIDMAIKLRQRYSTENPPFVALIASWVDINIKNLSNTLAVSDIDLVIDVWLVQGRSKQRDIYRKAHISSLAPLENKALPAGMQETIEHRLSQKFSDVFHELQDYYPEENLQDRWVTLTTGSVEELLTNGKQTAYQLYKPCSLEISAKISYTPAVHNGRVTTVQKTYKLTPIFQAPTGQLKSFLAGWAIEKPHR